MKQALVDLVGAFRPIALRDLQAEVEERLEKVPNRINEFGFDPYGLSPDYIKGSVLPSLLLSLALCLLALGLGALYFVYFWGVRGTTPGKQLLGLAVESADGRCPIGISQAFVRLLGYVLSTVLLGIGFVLILFGGLGLHDRIAGTRVVRDTRA